MTDVEVVGAIRSFFAKRFRNYQLRDDEDIFSLGFVSSLFAIQLVEFVEFELDTTVEEQDLEIENFRSVTAIVAFVERKRAQKSAA